MRKIATRLYKDGNGDEMETATYAFGENAELQVKATLKVWPKGSKSIEYFSVLRVGRTSQRWSVEEMQDLLNGFKNLFITGELP